MTHSSVCLPSRTSLRRIATTLLLAAAITTPMQAQGVRFSVAPAADYVNWDKGLGLDEATFYGGRLGLDFGSLAGLEGFYFTRSGIGTDLGSTSLTGPGGVPFSNQDVDVQNYGMDLTINLAPGRLVPFLKAGAGVFDVKPESSADFDQVMYQYGGGVKMDFSERVRGVLYIEDARFKLDRYALVPGGRPAGVPADPDADEMRSNLSIGAGLGFAIGGNKFDRGQGARERWSLASVPIEPFAGRIDFDDGSLGEQDLAGLRAGINVGNYVSLRGYYWRGVGSFFNDTDPIQSYGGEAQFNFTSGLGPSPFLILGAGNLDFRPGFLDRNGLSRSDRTVLLAGVGLAIRLTDQFRLSVGVRDYIYSDTGLDDVTSTSDLRHNPLLSAGIGFDIGRGRSRLQRQSRVAPDSLEDRSPERDAVAIKSIDENIAESQQDTIKAKSSRKAASGSTNISDQVVTIPVPTSGELYVRYGDQSRDTRLNGNQSGLGFMGQNSGLTASDMVLLREEIRRALRGDNGNTVPADSVSGISAGTLSALRGQSAANEDRLLARMDSLITARLDSRGIRVDTVGRRAVPDTVVVERDFSRQDPAAAGLAEDRLLLRIDSMVTARLNERENQREDLDKLEERLTERIDQSVGQRNAAPSAVVVTPSVPVTRRDSMRARMTQNPSLSALQPTVYSGLSFEGPTQILLGGRFDLTPYVNWGAFSLVPEFSIGLFNGTSVMGAANIQYELPAFEVRGRNFFPVARLGLGFFRFSDEDESATEGVLNLTYGFSTPIGGPTLTGERRHLFVEHQGLDLFDFNRLLVGVQWKY